MTRALTPDEMEEASHLARLLWAMLPYDAQKVAFLQRYPWLRDVPEQSKSEETE